MRTIILILVTFCSMACIAQTSSRKIVSWEAGNKSIYEYIINSDTVYSFSFRNAEYQLVEDYKSEIMGSKNEYIEVVEFLDSLMNNITLQKEQTLSYSFGRLKHLTLVKMMGKNVIRFSDNDLRGYCYLDPNDLKKLKQAIVKM